MIISTCICAPRIAGDPGRSTLTDSRQGRRCRWGREATVFFSFFHSLLRFSRLETTVGYAAQFRTRAHAVLCFHHPTNIEVNGEQRASYFVSRSWSRRSGYFTFLRRLGTPTRLRVNQFRFVRSCPPLLDFFAGVQAHRECRGIDVSAIVAPTPGAKRAKKKSLHYVVLVSSRVSAFFFSVAFSFSR